MNFDELIMQGARELGIEQYVSVSPSATLTLLRLGRMRARW
jgi:hypothetical protein